MKRIPMKSNDAYRSLLHTLLVGGDIRQDVLVLADTCSDLDDAQKLINMAKQHAQRITDNRARKAERQAKRRAERKAKRQAPWSDYELECQKRIFPRPVEPVRNLFGMIRL